MRASNWMVIAIALVASFGLLGAWFFLGYHEVDGPIDMLAAALWWLVVAIVIAAIVWAENRRRQKMLTAFVGRGLVYNPERGVLRPVPGESEISLLQRTLSGLTFADEVVPLDMRARTSFRWVVRTRKFARNGGVWEGEVLPAHTPHAQPRPFYNRETLAALLSA